MVEQSPTLLCGGALGGFTETRNAQNGGAFWGVLFSDVAAISWMLM